MPGFAGDDARGVSPNRASALSPVPTACRRWPGDTAPRWRARWSPCRRRAAPPSLRSPAQGQRRGILQMGAADHDDVVVGAASGPPGCRAARARRAAGRRASARRRRCAWRWGNVSLEDWLRLTSSLGCTGFLEPISPPANLVSRGWQSLRWRSMLDCVPEPVWNTTSGNSLSSRPEITIVRRLHDQVDGPLLELTSSPFAQRRRLLTGMPTRGYPSAPSESGRRRSENDGFERSVSARPIAGPPEPSTSPSASSSILVFHAGHFRSGCSLNRPRFFHAAPRPSPRAPCRPASARPTDIERTEIGHHGNSPRRRRSAARCISSAAWVFPRRCAPSARRRARHRPPDPWRRPCLDHLAGDHPVGQVAVLRHLQRAQDRQV